MDIDALYRQLNTLCKRIRHPDRPIIIAVSSLPGVGKSYLGRQLRKRGFGDFKGRQIAVIDDSVMTLRVLRFFRRKVRIARTGKDELLPFIKLLPSSVRVVFYMAACPSNRVSAVDILVDLETDEVSRRERLRLRTGGDAEKLQRLMKAGKFDPSTIKYSHRLSAHV
jgi:hypothetical protein